MVPASDIARYILAFFQERQDPISNMKLQKLLYYVQGWYLAFYDEAAFPEPIEAWVHGPVVREVFDRYRGYRWSPITEAIKAPEIPDELRRRVDEVLDVYGVETAWGLERRTHLEEPWVSARAGLAPDELSNNVIRLHWMKAFFASLADDEQDQEATA